MFFHNQETDALDSLRVAMTRYYTSVRHDRISKNRTYQQRKDELWQEMDAFSLAHPGMPACLLKAKLHEEIAERFEPILFRHSPFFFEMGVRFAENWGNPDSTNAASWLIQKRNPARLETSAWQNIRSLARDNPDTPWKLWAIWNVVDVDHHCLGYTKLLEVGVDGIIAEIQSARREATDPASLAFLEAAERSCRALIRVAERFAEMAESCIAEETDTEARKCFRFIADTARRIPAQPPQTFREGLAALLFLREATASLENIGISVLGHPDRLLDRLYRHDLAEGLLTEEDARDLIGRWMLHTDIKFHVDDSQWPETSTCVELGGCTADGDPVFNDVTRLFIETHRAHDLINPKLNCRYGSASPDTYVDLLARHAGEGHNTFAFLNDDVMIPALVRAGKTERQARLYVNGGCQETIAEGVEHSAGAYYYFNMARLLDLFLNPILDVDFGSAAQEVLPGRAVFPDTFDEFYARFIAVLSHAIGSGAGWLQEAGKGWNDVHPCPLFSSALKGCLENGRDYTAGGAIHNPATLALVGFGTVVDSLSAIHQSVFQHQFVSIEALSEAIASNWAGNEPLRVRMASLPKFGHGNAECDALAVRFARDIAALSAPLRNERGGPFLPSFFVYYFFDWMGGDTRATPDGRRAGEWLSQGISPGRVRPARHLTEIIHAVGGLDLRDFPGNAVLDAQLPLVPGGGMTRPLAALLRTFATLGGATLQTNAVSVAMLREAKVHPERHANLVVRISGLSARFVALTDDVQDEIIARHIAAM